VIDTTYAYRELLGQFSGTSFRAVSINVASPDVIRSWSHGEVKNPETINYRSFKPEKGGLFCERIFGPTKDWECNCGKYKRVKHKNVVCDRCGVEVTQSKVRRERMGHIELAVPVSHIWFFKCMPSRIGLMLDMTARDLEKIIYYEDWVVTDPGDTPLRIGQPLTDIEYRQAKDDYGDAFKADMGATAVHSLLSRINMDALRTELDGLLGGTKNKAIRKKLSKRIRLVEGFIKSKSRPEWMILEALPVIPPDLRPLVPLEGGRFATSDLNDLYRRVINRNNRLKNLKSLNTPEVIIRNEKRMLQEAVDALLDNGRHGRAVTGSSNRPLKSLSDMLKGKQGRFRQNLLGKRVDYSGRSVIVVGPELKLWQCGLPKTMALTLFQPFIIRFLKGRGYAHTVRGANKMIERGEPVVWDILEEVTKGHPVLLNRAPTLHRLSIQAFDPILIEGSAIRIHPLVCAAYNADFDGDQMAVHIPLSNEAQMECKVLMLSPNNIFSPAHGRPITTPTQDIALGVYYLTVEPVNPQIAKAYQDKFEVLYAFSSGYIGIHDAVKIPNPDYQKTSPWGDASKKFIITTPGRCIFNEVWDRKMGFYNHVVRKKELGNLISDSYTYAGHERTIKLLDDMKDMGFEYATVSGFSISITDLAIPESKVKHIDNARAEIDKINVEYQKGVITEGERRNKVIDVWTQTGNNVAGELNQILEKNITSAKSLNSVFAIVDSGARGSKEQIRQLAGMRGLMAKPSGDIIERPIISSFREGLTVLEYFISTHGARKGLADTALKTADSGYMTRKLVDVSQDVICRQHDCGTVKGIWMSAIVEGDQEILPLKNRIIGRFSAVDIRDPVKDDGSMLIKAGEEFTAKTADLLQPRGIKKVLIRSVLTCETESGVCIKCYGRNLANDKMAELGDALGIIAAQSIGEPGTQLTMRTFHIGGTASSAYRLPVIAARKAGTVKYENLRTVENEKGETVVVNKNGFVIVYDEDKAKHAYEKSIEKSKKEAEALGTFFNQDYDFWADAVKEAEVDRYEIEAGAIVTKEEGKKVKANEKFVSWDPYHIPIIAEEAGFVELHEMVEGITYERDSRGNTVEVKVIEHREDLHPQIVVKNDAGDILANYPLPAGAFLMVEEKERTNPGKILARVPRQIAKNKDIIGGLPRVSELLDARTPKDIAEIAKIDGVVDLGKLSKGKRELIIRDPDTNVEEIHVIPSTKHLTVGKGDRVRKGQKLTEGSIVPQVLLEVCGPHELQLYLLNQVQMVYKAQSVDINDKHIEIIIKQMMQKVRITEPGSSAYLVDEELDKQEFLSVNADIVARGGQPAEAEPVLLGITKAALATESFISAASFQDTTRILTDAATLGKVDSLRGFKENVITGHLIPAGTGIDDFQHIKLRKLGTELEDIPLPVRVEPKPERKLFPDINPSELFKDDDDDLIKGGGEETTVDYDDDDEEDIASSGPQYGAELDNDAGEDSAEEAPEPGDNEEAQ
jgi:DNA-directed RNA polymerase subunit beta'